MNSLKKILYAFLAIGVLVLLTQCKQKSNNSKNIDPAFSEYVSAFTSGLVSNQSEIIIRLTSSIADKEANAEEKENLLSISPSVEGKLYWKNSQTIVFTPNDLLPSNQNFEVKFKLGKIMKVPSKLKVFKFNFATQKQAFNVRVKGFKAYNNKDLTKQKLIGELETADFVKQKDVEKLLKAEQNSNTLDIVWEHTGNDMTHKFIIQQIKRTEEKGEVKISWSGQKIEVDDKGEKVVEIPQLGYFDVFDIEVATQPQQCITIYFTDPVNTEKDLNGLIYFENGTPLKLIVKDSEIKIYPEKPIKEITKLIIDKGIENVMNYKLNAKFVQDIQFSSIKPEIKFIGDGVILPNSKGLIFPFKAVNLNAVNVKIVKIFENNIAQFFQTNQYDGNRELRRVGRIVLKKSIQLKTDKPIDFGKWNNFSLDLSELIKTEPGAIYRVYLSFDKSQSLYPCDNNETEEYTTIKSTETDEEIEEYNQPYSGYYYDDVDYYYDDDYFWEERNDPCKKSYYIGKQISRNVLASNLGIIAKSNETNELKVAVTDITTAETMDDVKIDVYNYQNKLIGQGYTNQQGLATISLPYKGFLVVAKKDNQRGYLRIDDGSALSVSMFNVGGTQTKKGLKGYLFAERGVWRPGDSIYLQFILQDKNKTLPENHPVVLELFTPDNQMYKKKIKTNSLNGFYDFRTATNADDPTGNWLAKIKIGGSVFTKYLKIETIKPNRLRIKLDFNNKQLKKGTNNGLLKVEWLHGAKAKNMKADVEVSLTQRKTVFEKYKDFVFDDPVKKFASKNKQIFSGLLNEQGEANINANFRVTNSAAGMLQAKFKTRAFEKSGNFSTDIYTINYSPYESYVGVKMPEGEGYSNALYSNEPNVIPIVTLNKNGKPIDVRNVKIEVFELDWQWWWEQTQDYDMAQYVSGESQKRILVDFVNTKNGKAMFEMNLNTESWGRKLIRITNPVSKHVTGKIFYTTYKGWWENNENKNTEGAEMLVFNTDKQKYNVGEIVIVSLPETRKGNVLVSLETGSQILKTFWAKPDSKTFTFEVTEQMCPNVYINLSFIQPHEHTDNDLPIRMYGIQNILVENPETHLHPKIIMADVLEPEKEVSIKIKEANGKKMTYSIAVVDDGLLDLTRFKTPNAWNDFYAREALGIKTWDLYKYVVGAYSGKMAGLLAIGGDEKIIDESGKKANRFKPVVKFLGPFELKSGKQQTHKFTMPNYIGSVRTMVVASNSDAYGSAEKQTPVKKPLMVMATLPRLLSPTEIVKLPVTVFAMDKKVKNVKLSIETNDLFIVDEKNQNIIFSETGEQTVDFTLKVAEKTGVAKVKIIAKSGTHKSVYDIELNVRMPNPPVTQIVSKAIEPNKTWKTTCDAIGITGTNSAVLELSSMPSINLQSRLKYLIDYPHGCVEQTTSAIFPQIYLSSLITLNKQQSKQVEENVVAGIDKLKRFQQTNGGLSYWAGESRQANEWGTNYAGHFLLEAKAQGYNVPSAMMKKWILFQTKRANNWDIENCKTQSCKSRQLIQAYRLYTLALAKKPAMGAMNRMREKANLTNTAKWRLAAAYLLCGRKKAADKLISTATTSTDNYFEMSGSYGNSLRDQAMILEALALLNKNDLAKTIADDISQQLSSQQWLSTQTTAYCLLAMAKFINKTGSGEGIQASYVFNKNKKVQINTKNNIDNQILNVESTKNSMLVVKNESKRILFAKTILSGVPAMEQGQDANSNLNMTVKYTDLNNKPIDVTRLEQGTDFVAEVKISHPAIRGNYTEMALSQMFPSGWEIRNLRFEENTTLDMGNVPNYQDIRDDRVYTYFNLKKGQSVTYKVLLNASYAGKFFLPAVYCKAMYRNDINAQKTGKWVEVVK